MNARSLQLVVLLVLLGTPAAAQEVSDLDRFNLYNACAPMRLVVEELNDDAAAIGAHRGPHSHAWRKAAYVGRACMTTRRSALPTCISVSVCSTSPTDAVARSPTT